MLCDSCKNEMRITGFRYEIEGDKSADTPTKLYVVQTHQCVNKQCSQRGRTVEHRVLQEV